jgi:hypothetical protein
MINDTYVPVQVVKLSEGIGYTVQKEEPVRLILLMQRENILYMTDTMDIASYLADFYVLYKFASLEYVECTGILITLLITYSSDANLWPFSWTLRVVLS